MPGSCIFGNPLPAEQAGQWDLVNPVVEPEALISSCESLASDMASCDQVYFVLENGRFEGLRSRDELPE